MSYLVLLLVLALPLLVLNVFVMLLVTGVFHERDGAEVAAIAGGAEPHGGFAHDHSGAGAIFLPDVTPPNGVGVGGTPLGNTVLSSQG
jgi:hypothetical protein